MDDRKIWGEDVRSLVFIHQMGSSPVYKYSACYSETILSSATFSVSALARSLHDPSNRHLVLAKRILWYLSGTLDFGLSFACSKPTSSSSLRGAVDAEWGETILQGYLRLDSLSASTEHRFSGVAKGNQSSPYLLQSRSTLQFQHAQKWSPGFESYSTKYLTKFLGEKRLTFRQQYWKRIVLLPESWFYVKALLKRLSILTCVIIISVNLFIKTSYQFRRYQLTIKWLTA